MAAVRTLSLLSSEGAVAAAEAGVPHLYEVNAPLDLEASRHRNFDRMDDARVEFERAYEAKPLPGFLFNIGLCFDKLENLDKARYFFTTYLIDQPAAKNRAAVEKMIQAIDERKKARAASSHRPTWSPPRSAPAC